MAKAKRERRNSIRTMSADASALEALESLERAERSAAEADRRAPGGRARRRDAARPRRTSPAAPRPRLGRRAREGLPAHQEPHPPAELGAVVGDPLEVARDEHGRRRPDPRLGLVGRRRRRRRRPRRASGARSAASAAASSPSSASPRAIAWTARARVSTARALMREMSAWTSGTAPSGRTDVGGLGDRDRQVADPLERDDRDQPDVQQPLVARHRRLEELEAEHLLVELGAALRRPGRRAAITSAAAAGVDLLPAPRRPRSTCESTRLAISTSPVRKCSISAWKCRRVALRGHGPS